MTAIRSFLTAALCAVAAGCVLPVWASEVAARPDTATATSATTAASFFLLISLLLPSDWTAAAVGPLVCVVPPFRLRWPWPGCGRRRRSARRGVRGFLGLARLRRRRAPGEERSRGRRSPSRARGCARRRSRRRRHPGGGGRGR